MEVKIQEQLTKLTSEFELLNAKDMRNVIDAIKILSSKISRLSPQGEQSETIGAIATALAKAKLERLPLKESGMGNRGKYSTLEDYEDAYEKALAKHGLCIVFKPQRVTSDESVLATTLTHASGEWFRSSAPVDSSDSNTNKSEEQGFGASMSYMKRYSYAAMMGV